MDPAQLEQIKSRLAREFRESPGGDVDAMLVDIRNALGRSGLFTDIVAHKTGSREHLVEVRCRTISPAITARQVAGELHRAWQEDLRYDDFEAHVILPGHENVTLDFVTVAAAPRLYLTGMIVVVLHPVP